MSYITLNVKTYFYYKIRKPHSIAVLDSCAEISIPNATVGYDYGPDSDGRYEDLSEADIECEPGYKRYGPGTVYCDLGAWSEPIGIIRCVPNDQGRFNSKTFKILPI